MEEILQAQLSSLGLGDVSIPDLSQEQINLANTTAEEVPTELLFVPLPLKGRFIKGLSNVQSLALRQ